MLQEYQRFIQSLAIQSVSEGVVRIANLVKIHFAELEPLGTSAGKRSKKFIEIAQREFQSVSDQIEPTPNSSEVIGNPISRLTSLKVGPFRGFAREETFDLDSDIVLLYGPNGSGKSSFCEALEYGLIGSVEEAGARRLGENNYLNHAHSRQFIPPSLVAKRADQTTIRIAPSEDLFRFCFVEKNRIDNFSRMAAKPPAEQNRLIGSLFGLESFHEFVKGFSSELDGRYIDLEGIHAKDLAEKQRALQTDELNIQLAPQRLADLSREEEALALTWRTEATYAHLLAHLGTPELPARFQELERLLEGVIPPRIGLRKVDLETTRTALALNEQNIKRIEKELADQKGNISFRNLFQAVQELQPTHPDQCPACLTPLSGPATANANPYTRAESGLATLAHLAMLEQNLEAEKSLQTENQRQLKEALAKAKAFAASNARERSLPEWTVFQEHDWAEFFRLVDSIEHFDADILSRETRLTLLRQEMASLRGLRDKSISLKTKRAVLEKSIQDSRQNIAAFAERNRDLLQKVEEERPIVARSLAISQAYAEFVVALIAYKNGLPHQLLANLGSLIVELYNGFNRSDAASELLVDIKVPLATGERIQIAFNRETSVYFDALHVLSEGHIRCIGLAILLAKNLKEGCPFLIFDDPVNAIDDDHRGSIRRTIFEDHHFASTQIILTCHGEEFFKDIENVLGTRRARAVKRFTLLPSSGERHIQIDHSSKPRNYILAARSHFNQGEIRAALASARRAVEVQVQKAWKFLGKYGDGTLSIRLHHPNGIPETRNLADQLRSKIQGLASDVPNKPQILEALNHLLGRSGDSREWRYLNKATHEEEDRAEFDRSAVHEIISSLESLDTALTGR